MESTVISQVKKRDGSIVLFNPIKICDAIFRAAKSVGGRDYGKAKELAKKVIVYLEGKGFSDNNIPDVENVQDAVEKILIEEGHAKTAKAYIIYREQHKRLREFHSFVNSNEIMDGYISESDWLVKENSNMGYSLQGLNNHISSIVSSNYWLHKVYPQEVRTAHIDGDFHLHDLQILAAYCCGWDLQDLLVRGFGGVSGKVQSAPPKHLRAALGQATNFIYTLQGEIAGANAFSNFDTLLAPFVRHDNLNYKETKQALQEFLFNMNVPTRVGFQNPFSNLTMDLRCPKSLADKQVIIGGKVVKERYGDFQNEMDMVNRAFAELMMAGDSSGRVFTFPIPTYNVTKNLDWDNPELDTIWEMTAKYGTPYFGNFINSDMSPDDVRSMCLHPEEEIVLRNSGNIKRLSLGEVIANYKDGDFDEEGWIDCDMTKTPEVLSFNPNTYKVGWSKIRRFLRIKDNKLTELSTEDGKKIRVSAKHLVPVLTLFGFENKLARDVEEGDYLVSLKTAESALSKEYQRVGDLILDEDLAKVLGYFVADGNYLFESRVDIRTYGLPKGLQFTFNAHEMSNVNEIKDLIARVFGVRVYEKKDPRYNTYYLYVYNAELARKLFDGGFRKYGRLPHLLFNSPKSVIESFLEYHFRGDGYKKRKEIHINDEPLARDLVLLYSMIGKPVTYKKRKCSQVIRLQQKKSSTKIDGLTNNPILCERVPGWLAKSTYAVPGLIKSRMVGHDCLEKHGAHTCGSVKLRDSDCYVVRVKEVKNRVLEKQQEFFDFELEKDHLFMHSLGTITHNCCRLRLDNSKLRRKGGLFGAHPLTGSIGVVTLNMARIGYLSANEDEFVQRMMKLMDTAAISLEIKRKAVEKFTDQGLYPYSRHYLSSMKESTGSYWGNHFNTIGLLGMNEACLNLLGVNIADPSGKKFALQVMDVMLEKLAEYQKRSGDNYNLEATPAEGATYRLALSDKSRFPDIITAGDKEPYYTNSTHLPVNHTNDVFEALKLQDDLQCKYTGGTVLHGFLGEKIQDIETTKKLVRRIASNFKLPYFTLTPTFSVCSAHGYINGEVHVCPQCQSETEVYSRIVGYHRPVKFWNKGKAEEFKHRRTYDVATSMVSKHTNNDEHSLMYY